LAIDCRPAPPGSTFMSLPRAKKPIHRLSGDQNSEDAPSVPVTSDAADVSSEVTHRVLTPSAPVAM
jgi:hypothetical protein